MYIKVGKLEKLEMVVLILCFAEVHCTLEASLSNPLRQEGSGMYWTEVSSPKRYTIDISHQLHYIVGSKRSAF